MIVYQCILLVENSYARDPGDQSCEHNIWVNGREQK